MHMLTFVVEGVLRPLSLTVSLCTVGSQSSGARQLPDEKCILDWHPPGVNQERKIITVQRQVGVREPGKIAPGWVQRHPSVTHQRFRPGDSRALAGGVAQPDTTNDASRNTSGAQ